MKIKFYDINLVKGYINILSVFNLFLSFILIFFDIPQEYKYVSFIAFIIINVIIYLAMLIRANTIKK